ESGAQLACAAWSVQVGFTLEAAGEAAEVVAAAVVGQEGGWIIAVDRVGHFAEDERRGHALGQRQQWRLRLPRWLCDLEQDPGLAADAGGGEATHRVDHR